MLLGVLYSQRGIRTALKNHGVGLCRQRSWGLLIIRFWVQLLPGEAESSVQTSPAEMKNLGYGSGISGVRPSEGRQCAQKRR